MPRPSASSSCVTTAAVSHVSLLERQLRTAVALRLWQNFGPWRGSNPQPPASGTSVLVQLSYAACSPCGESKPNQASRNLGCGPTLLKGQNAVRRDRIELPHPPYQNGVGYQPPARTLGIDGIRTRTRFRVDTLATCLTTTVTDSRCRSNSPSPGVEPGSPDGQSGILLTYTNSACLC